VSADTARPLVAVTVVVELAARVPPICVPAAPEHLLVTHAVVHWKSLNVGVPDAGFETVTE
jgi:hypothetical protein